MWIYYVPSYIYRITVGLNMFVIINILLGTTLHIHTHHNTFYTMKIYHVTYVPDWSHDVNVTMTTGLYSNMSKMQLIIL